MVITGAKEGVRNCYYRSLATGRKIYSEGEVRVFPPFFVWVSGWIEGNLVLRLHSLSEIYLVLEI